jgi:hypothetical protein
MSTGIMFMNMAPSRASSPMAAISSAAKALPCRAPRTHLARHAIAYSSPSFGSPEPTLRRPAAGEHGDRQRDHRHHNDGERD